MGERQEFGDDILKKLEALSDKYAAMGQDLSAYLDGLLYADYLTYWDYINLDTLLSLQHPITPFPRRIHLHRLPPDYRAVFQTRLA